MTDRDSDLDRGFLPEEQAVAQPMPTWPEFEHFLAAIDNEEHRLKFAHAMAAATAPFPQLKAEYKWNQPMFTDHGTFITAFSVASKHFSVALEHLGMEKFGPRIDDEGYSRGKKLMRIRFDQPIPVALLRDIIEFQIEAKKDCTTFWAKS